MSRSTTTTALGRDEATIAAARDTDGRVVILFQPHLTRVRGISRMSSGRALGQPAQPA